MSHRILVVDDAEGSRYVIATWLRRDGYDVVESGTGEEALRIAAGGGIDLMVLDVNLPDMTGYVVCERIKADVETSMPVLHVSATAISAGDRSEGLRRGADAYLVEPVDREVLLASVGALLRGAHAERTARRLARRLRQLNEASHALNEARTVEYLAGVVARQACVLFERPVWVAITVGETSESAAFDLGTTGRDLIELDMLSFEELMHRAKGYTSVNFAGGESDRAVLVIGAPADDSSSTGLSDEDHLVLTQFARAATTALKNLVVYDIERAIAVTLQQSLLPAVVPEVPNAQLAVRYRASAEHAEVGGDFYEMFALRDRRIALAIGDVVGHSLEAAAIMAQLRTAIRSYMLEGHGPLATIDRLNAMLQRFHPGTSATVSCATYDWGTGECEIANAGHLPALLISGGKPEFLPLGGTLLGVTPVHRAPERRTLEPGDVLLFYTDGLIERRREGLDAGFERLAAAATFPLDDLEAFLDHVLAEVAPAKPGDDIALVALQRLPQSMDASLSVSRPADERAPSFMRAQIKEFLSTIGATPQVAADIVLATSEAVSNAIEHAYPQAVTGDVRMHAGYNSNGTVRIEIADDGAFLDRTPPAGRGRGLAIMRGVAREVKILRQNGTRVIMTFEVPKKS